MKLIIADDLALPIEAVTEKMAFLGRTGAGKTYGSSKVAEQMLAAKAQVIILDPVGNWFGLRLAADGKSPGIQIPIFGGLRGDLPLQSDAGAYMADLAVDRGISMILDISQFEHDTDKARFAAAWASRFFYRKKASPSAVHVFLEECQEFIPENPQASETQMLHAFIRMWKLGRNFGIGGSLITQRPQEVSKKALNLSEVLFAFQLTGTHERKAVKLWTADKGVDEDIDDILPKLPRGTARVWSPSLLRISKNIAIGPKWTFNASATPEVGRTAVARELAPVDIEKIRDDMAATIERAKAEDPKELRKNIAVLERELRVLKSAPASAPSKEQIDAAVERGRAEGRKELTRLRAVILKANESRERDAKKIADDASRLWSALCATSVEIQHPEEVPSDIHAQKITIPEKNYVPVRNPAAPAAAGSSDLGKCESAILAVLNQHGPCAVGKLALLAGYRYSGGFRNSLSALRTAGLITGSNTDTLTITEAGASQAVPAGDIADLAYWLNHASFGGAEREVLRWVSENPGHSGPQIAEGVGKQYSGGFRNTLSALRTAGVIEGKNGEAISLAADLQ